LPPVETYELLSILQDQSPETEFHLVTGSDWLQPGSDLRTWHKDLARDFGFIVLQRPGYDLPVQRLISVSRLGTHFPSGSPGSGMDSFVEPRESGVDDGTRSGLASVNVDIKGANAAFHFRRIDVC